MVGYGRPTHRGLRTHKRLAHATWLQLLWLPVEAETAETAAFALAALFAEHGPPLVLKSDNGSPFTAQPVRALLSAQGVTDLHSSACTPQYNMD